MYCGDETGSFIGEIGSSTSRFGYGGEDSPKYVVPSYVMNRCRVREDSMDVDPTTTTATATTNNSNSSSHNRHVATSCYKYRSNHTYETPLRTVQMPPDEKGEALLPIVDPTKYLQQGDSIEDWDAFESLWQSSFDALHVHDRYKHTKGGRGLQDDEHEDKKNSTTTTTKKVQSTTIQSSGSSGQNEGKACVHPILVVSPGCTHRVGSSDSAASHRKELVHITELMFEKMDATALFVAPAPMLAAFSHGRQTALVVDIGASGCRVTPIVDGLVLRQAQRRNGRGGDWLGNIQWHALVLEAKNVVRPRYQVAGLSATASPVFHRWAMQDLMYEFRTTSGYSNFPPWKQDTTIPFLYDDNDNENDDEMSESGSEGSGNDDNSKNKEEEDTPPPKSSSSTSVGGGGTAPYELPDGTLVDLNSRVGRDLCRIPELLFAEELPFLSSDNDSSSSSSSSILQQHATLSNLPLPQLIHASLSAVGDVDVRKDLASNIILTGASSLFPNLEQRLSYELSNIVNSTCKCKVLASKHSVERSCAPWIGGSVLTSLGSFQQLWLSKTEYEEYGSTLAVQRFP